MATGSNALAVFHDLHGLHTLEAMRELEPLGRLGPAAVCSARRARGGLPGGERGRTEAEPDADAVGCESVRSARVGSLGGIRVCVAVCVVSSRVVLVVSSNAKMESKTEDELAGVGSRTRAARLDLFWRLLEFSNEVVANRRSGSNCRLNSHVG